jgi:hypothetical protein
VEFGGTSVLLTSSNARVDDWMGTNFLLVFNGRSFQEDEFGSEIGSFEAHNKWVSDVGVFFGR